MAADLTVDTLDDAGIRTVTEALSQAGVLESVVGSGVLSENTEDRVEGVVDAADAEVTVVVLPLHGVSSGVIDAQVRYAEQVYAQYRIHLVVERLEPLGQPESRAILGHTGDADTLDFPAEMAQGTEGVAPGPDVDALGARV